mmetsp:Transcript_156345/g.501582  ORF Transcript_156345/g.501582 Transcript_156345/m.501582 type:complete len:251 (+) Transcript_156345:742-1494(+)
MPALKNAGSAIVFANLSCLPVTVVSRTDSVNLRHRPRGPALKNSGSAMVLADLTCWPLTEARTTASLHLRHRPPRPPTTPPAADAPAPRERAAKLERRPAAEPCWKGPVRCLTRGLNPSCQMRWQSTFSRHPAVPQRPSDPHCAARPSARAAAAAHPAGTAVPLERKPGPSSAAAAQPRRAPWRALTATRPAAGAAGLRPSPGVAEYRRAGEPLANWLLGRRGSGSAVCARPGGPSAWSTLCPATPTGKR